MARWQDALGPWWSDDAPRNGQISGADLFRTAEQWRSGARSATELLALTMAWGCGNVGHGQHRTRRMLGTTGMADRLELALRVLRRQDLAVPEELINADRALSWGGRSRIRGLGPAFPHQAAVLRRPPVWTAGAQSLILDARVARALPAAGGPTFPSRGWTGRQWLSYLTRTAERAAELGVPADVVEYRLSHDGRLPDVVETTTPEM
ncbi:hypothetical protein ACI8AK_02420 [Geodermatophilus sp. SYSU D00867]